MSGVSTHTGPDEAIQRIEGAILPSIGIMLDQLIESGRSTNVADSAERAAELRMMALQLEALVHEMNGLSLGQAAPDRYAEASAA